NKFQQQLALRVRLQASYVLDQGMVLTHVVEDVHIAQNRLTIAEDIKRATFGIAARSICCDWSLSFNEMQGHGVRARSDRHCVREMSPALRFIKLWIIRTERRLLASPKLPSFEIRVGTPPAAVVRVIGHVPSYDAHWPELATNSRQNLNGGYHGAAALS